MFRWPRYNYHDYCIIITIIVIIILVFGPVIVRFDISDVPWSRYNYHDYCIIITIIFIIILVFGPVIVRFEISSVPLASTMSWNLPGTMAVPSPRMPSTFQTIHGHNYLWQ